MLLTKSSAEAEFTSQQCQLNINECRQVIWSGTVFTKVLRHDLTDYTVSQKRPT